MTNLTPTLSHGDRMCLQALRDLAAKAGGSEPALLLTTIIDFLYQHAERLERLESPAASPSALQLAIRFHETYERLAPSFGYETRTDTRQFDPESKNGKLMVAVCGELAGLVPAAPQVAGGVDAARYPVEILRNIRDWMDGPDFEYAVCPLPVSLATEVRTCVALMEAPTPAAPCAKHAGLDLQAMDDMATLLSSKASAYEEDREVEVTDHIMDLRSASEMISMAARALAETKAVES